VNKEEFSIHLDFPRQLHFCVGVAAAGGGPGWMGGLFPKIAEIAGAILSSGKAELQPAPESRKLLK